MASLPRLAAILTVLFMGSAGSLPVAGASSPRAGASTLVIVHYHRFDGQYAGWNLWMWPHEPNSLDGAAYSFDSSDSFGQVAHAHVPGADTQVGIIVRLNNWDQKDVSQDRFIDTSSGTAEVWLIQGDATIYTSRDAAEAAVQAASVPRVVNAFLDSPTGIAAQLSVPATITGASGGFTVTDATSGQTLSVASLARAVPLVAVLAGDLQPKLGASKSWDPTTGATQLQRVNNDLYQFTGTLPAGSYQYKIALNRGWVNAYPADNVTLTVPAGGARVTFSFVPSTHAVYDSINQPKAHLPGADAPLTTDLVKLSLSAPPDVTHTLHLSLGSETAVTVIPRLVLNDPQYTYTGNDLGAVWSARSTSFRLWAPTASKVVLSVFKNQDGDVLARRTMDRSSRGTWFARVKGNLAGKFYLYQVTNRGAITEAVDPYARDTTANGAWGIIVDLKKTNPRGWSEDTYVPTKNPEDAVIYETHVRDFSIDRNSGMKHKGKFLAFTELGTKGPGGVSTGVSSLKQLGITHVELLPVFQFASVDETKNNQYNWGYDPLNYNVPEGEYATNPNGTARITQLKRLVQALHAQHIGVIMDVVYNHTFSTGNSNFDKIVPGYYYRTDYAGHYTNGSGVGNEVATERPQVRKFVLDSVTYWMRQYHIDGFRFDEMALLGKDTMAQISRALHAINPHTILLGEPWAGGTSGMVGDTLLTKGAQQGMHLAVFNDNIRDGIFGSTGDPKAQGYATGDPSSLVAVAKGLTGSITYSDTMPGFTSSPEETINYVTCHDNMTLWDKIHSSNPGIDETTAIKMDELAQTIVLLSQGVPFMQGGEEFLRTKGGNANSYNAGDAVNEFDWARKARYPRVFDYYAGLIHLRAAHPAFRMTSASDIKSHLRFLAAKDNVIQMELTGNANGDSWSTIDVILNPNKEAETVTLPGGTWTIVGADGHMGTDSLGTATGTFQVSGLTAAVLYGGAVGAAVDPTTAVGTKPPVAVTFNVRVPSNTPSGDTVFISGSIDALGPWDPGKVPMHRSGHDLWTVTLQIPDGTHLQYKYTRGTWNTVENWGTITGYTNRHAVISGGDSHTQTINDTATDWGQPGPDDHRAVEKWSDLPLP